MSKWRRWFNKIVIKGRACSWENEFMIDLLSETKRELGSDVMGYAMSELISESLSEFMSESKSKQISEVISKFMNELDNGELHNEWVS